MFNNFKLFFYICSLITIALVNSEKKALITNKLKKKSEETAKNLKTSTEQTPKPTTTTTPAATPAAAPAPIVAPPTQTPGVPDFTAARNINCTDQNCRIPNVCSADKKTCMCSAETAEYLLNKKLEVGESRVNPATVATFCAHERKNQLTYFLLELLLNVGAGHFYAGNTGLGVAKLLVVLLPCMVMCVLGCMGAMGEDKFGGMAVGTCLAISASCAISIWWLVDVIMIATNKREDGLGVPLKKW